MTCWVGNIGSGKAILTVPDCLKIMVNGKVYEFENPYPHPWPLTPKTREPMYRGEEPPKNAKWEGHRFWDHPFWRAVWWWSKQGAKVDGDGFAIYEPVWRRKPIIEQVTKRTRVCIGYSDEFEECTE